MTLEEVTHRLLEEYERVYASDEFKRICEKEGLSEQEGAKVLLMALLS